MCNEVGESGKGRPIGIHLSYWTRSWSDDLLQIIVKARDAGFDGVELPLLEPATMNFALLRKEAERNGLRLTCCTGLPIDADISHPDPETRRRGRDHIRRCLHGAGEVGSPVVCGVLHVGWGATEPVRDIASHRSRSAEVLLPLAQEAERMGISLCLEIINRYETFFLNTVAEGLELIGEIGHPRVKLNLDTYHMNIEEDDMAEAIRLAGPRLGHFHCAENNRKRPGRGHIPWHDIAGALDEVGYTGWIVMECFLKEGTEVGRTMRTWRALSADVDLDAAAGAQFLRKVLGGNASKDDNP